VVAAIAAIKAGPEGLRRRLSCPRLNGAGRPKGREGRFIRPMLFVANPINRDAVSN
jgi:hypothetical protein